MPGLRVLPTQLPPTIDSPFALPWTMLPLIASVPAGSSFVTWSFWVVDFPTFTLPNATVPAGFEVNQK